MALLYSYPDNRFSPIPIKISTPLYSTAFAFYKAAKSRRNCYRQVKQITEMKHQEVLYLLLLLFSLFASSNSSGSGSGIVFATLGRCRYAFDIFTLPISVSDDFSLSVSKSEPSNEVKMTDGKSVNYNGFFPKNPSSLLALLSPSPHLYPQPQEALVYVSERNASFNIYLDLYYHPPSPPKRENRRSALQTPSKIQIPLLHPQENEASVSMKDKPLVSGEHLIYVSTHEKSELPRKSWTAVYSTQLQTGETRRLTPLGIADYSPAISPSGEWTAVVSAGERGWRGEIEDLDADIYVFRTRDGSERTKVVDHGGGPCWADESTIYFHRQSDDGWWSVYRAVLPRQTPFRVDSVVVQRVTPPGFHAFTPAAAGNGDGKFIALATRRPTSEFRHIELLDLAHNLFVEITKPISPNTHHYNPFISSDSTRIGYHRCRGGRNSGNLLLENLRSPSPDISLFRIDGSFPSFSPDGDRIAFVGFPGVYVVNSDGTGKREVFSGVAFSTAWDWKRKGVIYTSHGPTFASERTKVDIISIHLEEDGEENQHFSSSSYHYKKLTTNGENNAFPSPSPDGKWVAFRSGRSGYKNLYIMDAVEGEKAGIRRLTEGPWTDTMCNWSPDGEWIGFASDRDDPGSGSFAIYLVHPNGTGLRKVLHSGEGGRTNHPWFSPDSKRIAFTSDYAGVSAEPVANPHHYQPYGDIFVANVDGSGITRLTHNSYEDGTPAWGPRFMKPVDVVEGSPGGSGCKFDDCHWLAVDQVSGVSSSSSDRGTCGLP